MRTSYSVFSLVVMLSILVTAESMLAQTRTRPATQKPPAAQKPAGDLKIKYKSTTGGQTMESATMIKGARERNEMNVGGGMDVINITQCDLKRTVQISDSARKYIITPMETGTSDQPATSPAPTAPQPSRRGGVVTYTSTATDTGERKQMYGFTARRVKTSLKIESSPDACNPVNQRMETDGWYIDFTVNFDCDLERARIASPARAGGGCRDRTVFKRQGSARTGYPLSETTTMYGPDGSVTFTSSKEVVELSREPLDPALFDIPTGYTEAKDTAELYAVPSMDTIMSQANQEAKEAATGEQQPQSTGAKREGVLLVGVVTINNKSGKPVSIDALRERLVSNIEAAAIDAIPLNAISPMEAEVEAKAKGCDYILYTDITTLKTSAAKKLGGMFGRVAGVEGIGKTEAKVEFKLFAVGETSPRLQSSATAKEEGDEASAGTALDAEARQVSAAIRKKS
jgi:hypothetical protein